MVIKSYLKIAIRNIAAQKGHSFINLSGLAIGMAACLLLCLWIYDELSFDRFHKKAARIYRVSCQQEYNGRLRISASTAAPLGPALVHEFPWITKAVRFTREKFSVHIGEKIYDEEIYFTDPGVFELFDFSLLKGNPKTVLQEPNSILISEDIKNKYFGKLDR